MCPYHVVAQGEFLAQVVARYGLADSQVVWELPENAELRASRASPNVLLAGDTVFIPDPTRRAEGVPVDRVHRFRRIVEQVMLRLRLQGRGGRPLAGRACTLHVDGRAFELTADTDGLIEQLIPASATTIELTLKDGDGRPQAPVRMALGHLDPVEELSGQRERLRNLGYYTDPGEDEQEEVVFAAAVEEFQCDHKLAVDGVCGPMTRAKLAEVHGC